MAPKRKADDSPPNPSGIPKRPRQAANSAASASASAPAPVSGTTLRKLTLDEGDIEPGSRMDNVLPSIMPDIMALADPLTAISLALTSNECYSIFQILYGTEVIGHDGNVVLDMRGRKVYTMPIFPLDLGMSLPQGGRVTLKNLLTKRPEPFFKPPGACIWHQVKGHMITEAKFHQLADHLRLRREYHQYQKPKDKVKWAKEHAARRHERYVEFMAGKKRRARILRHELQYSSSSSSSSDSDSNSGTSSSSSTSKESWDPDGTDSGISDDVLSGTRFDADRSSESSEFSSASPEPDSGEGEPVLF